MSASLPLSDAIARSLALCREVVARGKAPRKWMWGDALFGYALSEYDRLHGSQEFTPALTAYCDHYLQNPPHVDYADRAAPALITYAMQKLPGNGRFVPLTDAVLQYIRQAPRILGDAVNHLGHSLEGRLYPQSIWVDSLMMFGLFPALYAREQGDAELLAFAARQPRIYSGFMQSPEHRLWYHSYWVRARRPHPGGELFWGRGNGWVMAALPRMLDIIGPENPEYDQMLRIFQDTAEALIPLENPDHSYNTLLRQPSYRELSATALIAAGLMHGARAGYLAPDRAERGAKSYLAVTAAISEDDEGLYLPEISAPTIPLQLFPGLCYRLTPRGRNWSYGLAALLFAAMEAEQLA